MFAKRVMWIVWPAFLVAGMLEVMVFAMVDPQDLRWFGQPLALSRQGVYTLAFFVFWFLALVGGSLTTLLAMSSAEVNQAGTLPPQHALPDDSATGPGPGG